MTTTRRSASDADIIQRSLTDPAAFAALFDRHYAAVHAYATRRAGRADGEDVAADVFLRAFDRRRDYDLSFIDARPWLLGIASNLLRRRWRSDRRRLAALARLPAEPGAAAAPSPSLAREVVDALDTLSAHDRETLLLHAWGDLSYEELARALAIPIGTVRSRLARARATLRGARALEPPLNLSLAEEPTNV